MINGRSTIGVIAMCSLIFIPLMSYTQDFNPEQHLRNLFTCYLNKDSINLRNYFFDYQEQTDYYNYLSNSAFISPEAVIMYNLTATKIDDSTHLYLLNEKVKLQLEILNFAQNQGVDFSNARLIFTSYVIRKDPLTYLPPILSGAIIFKTNNQLYAIQIDNATWFGNKWKQGEISKIFEIDENADITKVIFPKTN